MDPHDAAERAVQDLLAADAVLPDQFWGSRHRAVHLSGERALMWAVLAEGIDCYRRTAHGTSVQQRAEFEDAERWVLTTDWDWPFSFVNLCEAFGFEPEAVRRALERWKHGQKGCVRRQRFRPVTLQAA